MKWELEEGGTLGSGQELSPVQFPRSDEDRDNSATLYKGAASQTEDPLEASKTNDTGNVNVPRHSDAPIDYYDQGDGTDVYTVGAEDADGGRDANM